MPTRRIPIIRNQRPPAGPEWLKKFRRMCELTPTRRNCIANHCISDDKSERCGECSEHTNLHSEFKRHFKFKPWCMFPDSYEAPDGLTGIEATVWWDEALQDALTKVDEQDRAMKQRR